MARFNWLQVSAGFAPQISGGAPDYNTPNTTLGNYRIFPCALDGPPTPGRQGEDLRRKTGQFGAQSAPLPGSRDGTTFTTRMPFYLGRFDFDPTTDTWQADDQASPAQVLLANIFGSRNSNAETDAADFQQGLSMWPGPYAGGGVASSGAANTVTVKNPTPGGGAFAAGEFFASVDDTSTVTRLSRGWIKSIASHALTMFEDFDTQPQADDDILPTWTLALTEQQQIPLTWQFWGVDASQLIRLIGCVATEVRIMGAPGKTPEIEIDWICTDFQWIAGSGGLQTPTDEWRYARPVTGEFDARTTIGGDLTCGLEEWMLTVTLTVNARGCASGLQGVSARDTDDRTPVLTFQIPDDMAGYATIDNDNAWSDCYLNGYKKSLSFMCGDVPGAILAILLPRAHLATPPQLTERNNALYWTLSWRADTYSDDGGSTAPADTICRVGGA